MTAIITRIKMNLGKPIKRAAVSMIAATLVCLATQSSLAQPLQLQSPDAFNVKKMQRSIRDTLKGNAVGYAFAIARGGKIVKKGAGGYAQLPGDGNKKMKPGTRINIMSATKPITAIALLRLLDQRNLTIDSPIAEWLPPGWPRGKGFKGEKGLTFKQLLTHTSGLEQAFRRLKEKGQHQPWGNDWDGLKFIVGHGIKKKDWQLEPDYKNANFALMRVLIPALMLNPQQVTRTNYAGQYMLYVGSNVTQPSGINTFSCTRIAGIRHSKAYKQGDNVGAWNHKNSNVECGGHAGLQLSAVGLAKIAAAMRCRGGDATTLSRAQCRRMNQHLLGWDKRSNRGVAAGKFWHGGKRVGKEINTCIILLPNDIEAGLIVNSDITPSRNACTILSRAFDHAKT